MDANVLKIVSMVCYGCSFICLIVTVSLFVKFDILSIYREMTGKNLVRGVFEIRQRNEEGNRNKKIRIYDNSHQTRKIFRELTGKLITDHLSKQLDVNETEILDKKGAIDSQETEVLGNQTVLLTVDETTVLTQIENLNQEGKDIDIHFRIIEEIKVIHSDHTIKEGGLKNE